MRFYQESAKTRVLSENTIRNKLPLIYINNISGQNLLVNFIDLTGFVMFKSNKSSSLRRTFIVYG